LQNQFAVVIARTFGFPQFIGFGIRVFLKVGASVGVGACGVDGTDEVWVAAVEETAIALREFGHDGVLRFWSGFSFSQMGVLVAIANGVV
jgi:hypothetical protein